MRIDWSFTIHSILEWSRVTPAVTISSTSPPKWTCHCVQLETLFKTRYHTGYDAIWNFEVDRPMRPMAGNVIKRLQFLMTSFDFRGYVFFRMFLCQLFPKISSVITDFQCYFSNYKKAYNSETRHFRTNVHRVFFHCIDVTTSHTNFVGLI